MFVASRVESGNEGKAVAALLPQVIGTIQTVTGCGTLRRAGSIAVRVMTGDPLCQGDVIETAADGWIGIRFIDGTVFNLSRSTRVMLNEFVCDSSGTSHSVLFGVTRGTFAFIGGQVAKTGCLRIDTPVGSIRGRARAGGIGTLSLIALTFAVMQEVQAADPNVTFLTCDIAEAVATALSAAGGKNLEVLGADLASQCLQRGLVDEILVYVLPVLLGDGVRFSTPTLHRIDLEPFSNTQSGAVTMLRFRVPRASSVL